MSDELTVVPFHERLSRNLWRILLIAVTVAMAAFAWHDPVVAVFAAAPVLIWCLGMARTEQTGLVCGLILLVFAAWILLPRDLGLSGRWVPSVYEVCVILPIISALICAMGLRAQRSGGCAGAIGLSALVLAGFVTAGLTVLDDAEGYTGAEGVWPGPSGLQVVELDSSCGSGGCTRSMEATGDRAAEQMRDYLDSRGFTTPGYSKEWTCRIDGLLLTYKVCATVKEVTPTAVQVSWSN
ncbi:hypothetical protein [Kibdelosporangium aridum]|uniref:hypothetical protein n=1 Tax=Kibdelosporangium aridum TaxID=2030 RepID=UPI0009FBCEC8|nr:hypothetical protein [Kibdelosporangium aridum]